MADEMQTKAAPKDFKLWLEELKSPERRAEAIQKFYEEFSPNVKKAVRCVSGNTDQSRDELYQEGLCLMLEFLASGKLDHKESWQIPACITWYVKYRLKDYLKKYNYKHNKKGKTHAVEEEQEAGTLVPLMDPADDIRPEELYLDKETALRMQQLNQKIRNNLTHLPAREEKILRDFFLHNKSMAEISRELNFSLSNSYRLKDCALDNLRKLINNEQLGKTASSKKQTWIN